MAAASGILATVIPFGQSVGDSMDLPRCFATLRLPCQARGLHAVCASSKTGGAQAPPRTCGQARALLSRSCPARPVTCQALFVTARRARCA